MTKAYQNIKFQQPYEQAMSYCSMVLQDRTWPWTEQLDALTHLEAEDLVNFVPMLLSRTFVECYVAGTNLNILYDSVVSSPFILYVLVHIVVSVI